MRARDILKAKVRGSTTFTIGADEIVATAVGVLAQKNIGALVVTDQERIVGVIDERDIVRRLATHGAQTLRQEVRAVMKTPVLTCSSDDEVKQLMERMTERRVRHLPVVDDGGLEGVVSIGDLLKHRLREMETEQGVLRDRLLATT